MSLLHLVFSEYPETPLVNQSVRVLGIDLGTTNSTVAEIIFNPETPDDAQCICLPLEQKTTNRSHWNPIVPSCVALHDGREWIGMGAKQLIEQAGDSQLIDQTNLFHSCKNDMGLQRTYAGAPNGYRNACDISSRILSFLYKEAHKQNKQKSAITCVTVPASFQLAQRNDTIRAANNAAISLTSGELLDEPIAAFISYLEEYPEVALTKPGEERTLLVFDFGGGTCDVGLFRLSSNLFKRMDISPLAVSRYHRLGGGDIDQAILYEVLLSQILTENNLEPNDLDYEIKKNHLEPAFIGIAEQLKILLCEKVDKRLNIEELIEIENFRVELRGEFVCRLPDGGELELTDPFLDLVDFNKLMQPFLDPDLLFVKETEYRQTLSIFTPIHDALGRLDIEPDEVDLCLLVGGSSLIPHIKGALTRFFDKAEILTFDNADATQMAVARGAAINALAMALSGKPVIQPICQETIGIMTTEGIIDLVPQKAILPWPNQDAYAEGPVLSVPQDSGTEPLKLKVEVVARDASGQRILLSEHWDIPAPVRAGEKLQVESRFDLNQTLQLRLIHLDRKDVPIYEKQEEHPFTHVANPQAVKLRIEKTEELLRTGAIAPTSWNETMIELADDCAELRQYEKAISQLSRVLRHKNEPDAGLLNKMALYAGYMGDQEREEKIYRMAIDENPDWGTLWFNLALLLKRQDRLDAAREAIDTAIKVEPEEAPYYVLQAQLAKAAGQSFAIILDLANLHARALADQDSWELHWSIVAAELRGDKEKVETIRKLRQKKSLKTDKISRRDGGCLPGVFQRTG